MAKVKRNHKTKASVTNCSVSSVDEQESFQNENATNMGLSSSDLDLSSDYGNLSSERDEVKEVKKASREDTRIVQKWRLGVTFTLLLTAFVVTLSSYKLLKAEERNNFETAVSFREITLNFSLMFGPSNKF